MGHDCGYLALMSGLATGAERVYLPEEGITLEDLSADVHDLSEGFRPGKRLGLVIRSENADPRLHDRLHDLAVREGGRRACSTPGTRSSDTSRRAGTPRRSTASRPPG